MFAYTDLVKFLIFTLEIDFMTTADTFERYSKTKRKIGKVS